MKLYSLIKNKLRASKRFKKVLCKAKNLSKQNNQVSLIKSLRRTQKSPSFYKF